MAKRSAFIHNHHRPGQVIKPPNFYINLAHSKEWAFFMERKIKMAEENKEQATQPVAEDKNKGQATTPVQDTNAQETQPTKDDKPKEVKPVIFWISGMINGQQIDCDGPYSTMQDDPKLHIYPYTTVAPNPQFTYQKFDYMAQKWIDISAPTVEQTVGDLKQDVKTLTQSVNQTTQNQAQFSQASNQTTKQVTDLAKMIAMMNVNLGNQTAAINALAKKVGSDSTPVQPTQPATDSKKEGNA